MHFPNFCQAISELRELAEEHYHHSLPSGNLVPCGNSHPEFQDNRRITTSSKARRGGYRLSTTDISHIVEVDRLTLRPNGISMTEEELVGLAYELHIDTKLGPSPKRPRRRRKAPRKPTGCTTKQCPECGASALTRTYVTRGGAAVAYNCLHCKAKLLVLASKERAS